MAFMDSLDHLCSEFLIVLFGCGGCDREPWAWLRALSSASRLIWQTFGAQE
ncbi:MAG: hypothetical protein IT288_17035 [Bdellovibrionales bacterium]|nr:hypothetical protein [Bdellovibrionales bacterium]